MTSPVSTVPVRPSEAGSKRDSEHRQAANRALGFSAVGLAITGVVELALALLTGSVGLLGDALHNLSDVSTSAVVFLGFHVSKKPANERYNYGFDRAEDLAGLGVALVIWLSAAFAGIESYRKLTGNSGTTHLGLGMCGAALGIVGNQLVARYKSRVGRRIHSATLLADAKHSWLDALSSLGALGGLIGVAAGYRWADAVAGFVVTLFICHVGYEVTVEIAHHLLDGVEAELMASVKSEVESVPEVVAASVRGRWTGRSLIIDVDATVAASRTVEQAELIGDKVTRRIRARHDQVRVVNWSAHPAPGLFRTSSDHPVRSPYATGRTPDDL